MQVARRSRTGGQLLRQHRLWGAAVRDSLVAVIRVVEAVVGRKPTESSLWRDYGRLVMGLDQAVHEVPPPSFSRSYPKISTTHVHWALCGAGKLARAADVADHQPFVDCNTWCNV